MTKRYRILTAAALALALALVGVALASSREGPPKGWGSPAEAVAAFLEPFGKPGDGRDSIPLWPAICRPLDPQIRKAMRIWDKDSVDLLSNCGGGARMLAIWSGVGGAMALPANLVGTPVAARTAGETSVVTVAMQYTGARPRWGQTVPPASATVDVLTVKREGGWFVGTPGAVSPENAVNGGLSEAQLRAEHARLVARSK